MLLHVHLFPPFRFSLAIKIIGVKHPINSPLILSFSPFHFVLNLNTSVITGAPLMNITVSRARAIFSKLYKGKTGRLERKDFERQQEADEDTQDDDYGPLNELAAILADLGDCGDNIGLISMHYSNLRSFANGDTCPHLMGALKAAGMGKGGAVLVLKGMGLTQKFARALWLRLNEECVGRLLIDPNVDQEEPPEIPEPPQQQLSTVVAATPSNPSSSATAAAALLGQGKENEKDEEDEEEPSGKQAQIQKFLAGVMVELNLSQEYAAAVAKKVMEDDDDGDASTINSDCGGDESSLSRSRSRDRGGGSGATNGTTSSSSSAAVLAKLVLDCLGSENGLVVAGGVPRMKARKVWRRLQAELPTSSTTTTKTQALLTLKNGQGEESSGSRGRQVHHQRRGSGGSGAGGHSPSWPSSLSPPSGGRGSSGGGGSNNKQGQRLRFAYEEEENNNNDNSSVATSSPYGSRSKGRGSDHHQHYRTSEEEKLAMQAAVARRKGRLEKMEEDEVEWRKRLRSEAEELALVEARERLESKPSQEVLDMLEQRGEWRDPCKVEAELIWQRLEAHFERNQIALSDFLRHIQRINLDDNDDDNENEYNQDEKGGDDYFAKKKNRKKTVIDAHDFARALKLFLGLDLSHGTLSAILTLVSQQPTLKVSVIKVFMLFLTDQREVCGYFLTFGSIQ